MQLTCLRIRGSEIMDTKIFWGIGKNPLFQGINLSPKIHGAVKVFHKHIIYKDM
ncbi:hypothetical protein KsCSTR_06680 [Candidatus Kuenenia stuttgartiensis]|uniref:Uncharacterized protein n=1 Tax=Kuenenia stuttgartiensis TaxID=174633 RepID=Q1PZS3_KUEST|nr:hypothetical protein KsCSTR_06680 [Candidatus Kuenenia stuttgartiensis]CAJ72574.1 unknown protein [Candidatus Kuenenia stuttgartiensis]SOH04082.1 hypothetical protein KSMBR1_1583 [Candidatus Kuenenia stuttgartiensis]